MATVAGPSSLLRWEEEFTRVFQEHEFADPVTRELAAMRAQFPALLLPAEDHDLFVGRLRYPLAGFLPEPDGIEAGFYCQRESLEALLADESLGDADHEAARGLLRFWEGRSTREVVRSRFPAWVAERLPSDLFLDDVGVAYPLYRMAGMQLDLYRLLQLGVPGLRAAVADRLAATGGDEAGKRFCEGCLGVLDLFCEVLQDNASYFEDRAASTRDPARAGELMQMALVLSRLPNEAPWDLRSAIQLFWLYNQLAGSLNMGRMDEYLGDFLVEDLDSGRLTEERAVELLVSLWHLIVSIGNEFNCRVILGGRGRRNPENADRFALLAMEAHLRVREHIPQLSLRFYEGQNPALMKRALDLIGEGCTFPILYNDDVSIPAAAAAMGISESEAVHYLPFGCGEYMLNHRNNATPNGIVNTCKALELALRDGVDPLGGCQRCPSTGSPASWSTFDELWKAYTRQVEYFLDALAAHQRLEFDVVGEQANYLLASMLHDGCLERGRGLFCGGLEHLDGTMESYGDVNTADSLTALKRLVFDERRYTLEEVVAACDADWQGYEPMREALLAAPKFGNDDPEADAMRIAVHEHVCRYTRGLAKPNGLRYYLVVVINNKNNVIQGQATGATPDGRRRGDAFANANNPAPGNDRSGVTAFLSSLAGVPNDCHAGMVQNMKFSREMFTHNRPKLELLLETYWQLGGAQAMITVLGRQDLENAMREPENYGHLMVRVGGFSARFVDLEPEVQREILERTLY